MSLFDFLCRWNGSPVLWGFIRRLVPQPRQTYSWWRVISIVGIGTLPPTILCLGVIVALLGRSQDTFGVIRSNAWGISQVAGVSFLFSGWWALWSRIAWHRRRRQLLDRGGEETTVSDAPLSSVAWVGRSLVDLVYLSVWAFLVPLALWHVWAGIPASRRLKQRLAELQLAGTCLKMECLHPAAADARENYFATPFWKSLLDHESEQKAGEFLKLPPLKPSAAGSERGKSNPPSRRTDLALWAAAFRRAAAQPPSRPGQPAARHRFPVPSSPGEPAEDVLLALGVYDELLKELDLAAPRARNVYPLDYSMEARDQLPHLDKALAITQISLVRCAARLAQKNHVQAAADVRRIFRLAESLGEEPILLSRLVQISIGTLGLHPLADGLVNHQWSATELEEFGACLQRLNYPEAACQVVAAARADAVLIMERFQQDPARTWAALTSPWRPELQRPKLSTRLLWTILPPAWIDEAYLETLNLGTVLVDGVRSEMNATHRFQDYAKAKRPNFGAEYESRLETLRGRIDPSMISTILLSAKFVEPLIRFHRAETQRRLAWIACALERHYLAHGEYPIDLKGLAPNAATEIPVDWMSGRAFHYQRTGAGTFRLWSVGPDGDDDGGSYFAPEDKRVAPDGEPNLDWVWPMAADVPDPRKP